MRSPSGFVGNGCGGGLSALLLRSRVQRCFNARRSRALAMCKGTPFSSLSTSASATSSSSVADAAPGAATSEAVDAMLTKALNIKETVRARNEERVRFAPSPTGSLHVGGARTALYNWLHARNTNGRVILRVEDTDVARSTRESEESMLRDLRWLGIDFDEGPGEFGGETGPYRQSERGELYRELAFKLLDEGHAYRCFCTEEELEAKRKQAEAEGRPPQYDGTWRDADPAEVQKRLDDGEQSTIRFRIPAGTVVTIDDVVRGRVTWDANSTVGDFILLRSSGVPVYNFCVAVDDALMGITTVIRAEEHLTNSLRQVLILRALGFDAPRYAHCSLILGADRQKLSKRHGATSCEQFRKRGFLPHAMLNFLSLLGWNDGTERELYFSPNEIGEVFDLNRVSPSPTMFDEDKLVWMNGQHLRNMSVDELAPFVREHLVEVGALAESVELSSPLLRLIVELFQGSMDVINDVSAELSDALSYPVRETLETEEAKQLLAENGGFNDLGKAIVDAFDAGELPDGSSENHAEEWKKWIKATGKAHKRKGKGLFHPVRLALTGKMSGPDVGQVLRLLKLADGSVPRYVSLDTRIDILRRLLDEPS